MNQTAEGLLEIAAEPRLVLQSGIIRKSECVILGFLVYAVVLGASLPPAQPIRHLVTMLNAGIFNRLRGTVGLRRPQAETGLRPSPRHRLHGAYYIGVPPNGLVRATACEAHAGS